MAAACRSGTMPILRRSALQTRPIARIASATVSLDRSAAALPVVLAWPRVGCRLPQTLWSVVPAWGAWLLPVRERVASLVVLRVLEAARVDFSIVWHQLRLVVVLAWHLVRRHHTPSPAADRFFVRLHLPLLRVSAQMRLQTALSARYCSAPGNRQKRSKASCVWRPMTVRENMPLLMPLATAGSACFLPSPERRTMRVRRLSASFLPVRPVRVTGLQMRLLKALTRQTQPPSARLP
ncbi:hypothetical protein D3C80_873970 [compost metagenome]